MLVIATGAGKLPIENIRNNTTTSAAGAACSVTLAAVNPGRHIIHSIQWSYTAAPTGGKLTVAVNSVTVKEVDITAAGPGGYNLLVLGGNNQAVVITLAAPGGAVVGKLNVDSSISNE